MQVKHIDEIPILQKLARSPGEWHMLWGGDWKHIEDCFPPDTPWKVKLAKMSSLIRRGLVDGCPCGCRGDFEITEKGERYLVAKTG